MNCLLETVASIWMVSLRSVYGPVPVDEEICVQEGLEGCRASLEQRESDLSESVARLGQEALKRRQFGDMAGARTKLLERRRAGKRLEKLRSSLTLVDAQLDALRSTELDKELMQTLMASSAALKRAGVGKGVKEAEDIMSDLETQLRESSELTSVLSGPLIDDGELDLDEELDLLSQDSMKVPAIVNAQSVNAGPVNAGPVNAGPVNARPVNLQEAQTEPTKRSEDNIPTAPAPRFELVET